MLARTKDKVDPGLQIVALAFSGEAIVRNAEKIYIIKFFYNASSCCQPLGRLLI